MTKAELAALADIRGYAAAGRIELTKHARERMVERNVKPRDLRSALVSASSCKDQRDGTWKATGPDLDGDALDVVVVFESGVLVVTVF
jgi:pentatricopeptide repeat protein